MLIAVIMGSDADWLIAKETCETLKKFNIPFEVHVLSAHRSPIDLINYVKHCEDMGCNAFICLAGKAAHLPGVVASHTKQPVIGVPLSGGTTGFDSLLSTVQMPAGVPVATVSLDGGVNAAILAIQMLAISNKLLLKQLADYKEGLRQAVLAKDNLLQEWAKTLSS